MKIIPENKLNKGIHFPIIQGVPDDKKRNIFSKIFKFLTFRRKWKLKRDYILWCEYLKEYIFVPKGFVFDGASVPKALHSFLGPNGILLLGACPHDEGYRYRGLIHVREDRTLLFKPYTKHELDKIFFHLCKKESSLGIISAIATLALILFGWTGWLQARNNNNILTDDFPYLF